MWHTISSAASDSVPRQVVSLVEELFLLLVLSSRSPWLRCCCSYRCLLSLWLKGLERKWVRVRRKRDGWLCD